MTEEHAATELNRQEALEEIAAQVRRCQLCPLYKGALKGVPGEGDPQAEVMLIGEAPGWHENQQGRPFVGAAGQFLTDLLRSVGLRREQVFIGNVIKHRPPDNRDPLPDELRACLPYLDRQIEIIDPKVIVTLGRFSMARFFPGEKISRVHGVARRHGDRLILPLYHPAAALHQGSLRRVVEEDFKRLPDVLEQARKLAPATPAPTPAEGGESGSGGLRGAASGGSAEGAAPAQQLSLF
ncbi:MAG TPA: uracil-DNA glycosylase [Chloroflexota bacterium]|nr:uracil-DNA glycosylase [Chloroflexota bacterium]